MSLICGCASLNLHWMLSDHALFLSIPDWLSRPNADTVRMRWSDCAMLSRFQARATPSAPWSLDEAMSRLKFSQISESSCNCKDCIYKRTQTWYVLVLKYSLAWSVTIVCKRESIVKKSLVEEQNGRLQANHSVYRRICCKRGNFEEKELIPLTRVYCSSKRGLMHI